MHEEETRSPKRLATAPRLLATFLDVIVRVLFAEKSSTRNSSKVIEQNYTRLEGEDILPANSTLQAKKA